MIIPADRTGILPRLVSTPRHPLLDVHATNSTNFCVSRLFDLARIRKGTIRHAPQDNAINHRQRCGEPQLRQGSETRQHRNLHQEHAQATKHSWDSKSHWQHRFQINTTVCVVLARTLILCSKLVIIKPTLFGTRLLVGIVQICRLRGSQKCRRGQTSTQQSRLVHARSCGWLHQICVGWHSFSHMVSSWRLHTHLHRRPVTSIHGIRPPRMVGHVRYIRHILGEHIFKVENWSPTNRDFAWLQPNGWAKSLVPSAP